MDGLAGPKDMLQHVGAHDDVKGLVGQRHVRDIRNDVNVRIAVPRDILRYGQPKQNSEVWRKKNGIQYDTMDSIEGRSR